MRLVIAFVIACLLPGPSSKVAAIPIVALVTPPAMPAPAAYGAERLRKALAARGFRVVDGASDADVYVRFAIDPARGCPESLSIARASYRGRPAIDLRGGDATGLMYAALDTADRVAWSGGADPFVDVRQADEQPFLHERGVSMYTMQRALFEKKLYDETYWRKYFDLLAGSRINTFVVIFGYENGGFMAPPYPYFYDTPEFPGVRMVGLSAEQQARNTAAFKTVIRLAHERGIHLTAAIWDHIYRAGVQTGGIQGAAKGDAPTPGLVWGVTGDNLAAYSKAALKKFLAVFPDIDGIQFRMHDESGLKPEEMNGFWHEVFAQIKATRPDLKIDLRAKGLPDAVIDDALQQGLDARVSTKFWMEQMGLPFHPTQVNPQDQQNRRHGYADLLRYPQRYRVHWQLWTGGTARLLLWGDPDYVRRFASAAKLYGGDSFDVNEMLATKMLGEPHDAAPIDILNPRYRYYDYEFERYWHFYQLWGRLTYAPDTPSESWDREFTRRFGAGAGPHIEAALHRASQVLPRIVASSYRYNYFPTTRGWAEMQHQDALPAFASLEGSDTEQFLTPAAEARRFVDGTTTTLRRPQESAAWFTAAADAIDAELSAAASAATSAELASTITDCRILSGLARYYAARLPAAVAYDIYKQNGEPGGVRHRRCRRATGDRRVGVDRDGGRRRLRLVPAVWRAAVFSAALARRTGSSARGSRQAGHLASGRRALSRSHAGRAAAQHFAARPSRRPPGQRERRTRPDGHRARHGSARPVGHAPVSPPHAVRELPVDRHDGRRERHVLGVDSRRVRHPRVGRHLLRRGDHEGGCRPELSRPRPRDSVRDRPGSPLTRARGFHTGAGAMALWRPRDGTLQVAHAF